MRLLLIEDDPAALRATRALLREGGFLVDTAMTGEEGMGYASAYDYDLIILDLDLPDIDGHDVLRDLRARKRSAPLLVVSGYKDMTNKVRSLLTGADDYITKPYAKEELLARIQAVIRRANGFSQPVIEIGRIAVDLGRKIVETGGAVIPLTSKEYQIMELLALRKGMTLTKTMFLDHLYGGVDEPEIKIIDVFICKLRKKISQATGGAHYIETVWGRGYALREPNGVKDSAAA